MYMANKHVYHGSRVFTLLSLIKFNEILSYADKFLTSFIKVWFVITVRLCGLVVRVPGYRSRAPVRFPALPDFSGKEWVWNGVHSAS
jgi:hypothetical protein